MSNRYIFLTIFCVGFLFSYTISAMDPNALASLFGGSSGNSSDNQLVNALFGGTNNQPTTTNIQTPVAATPVVTAPVMTDPTAALPAVSNPATPAVPVVSAVSSNQPATSDDITNQINNALVANQSSIAQGIEQRVQGSVNSTDAQKQSQEQRLIGQFAENPALVKYLQNYVKMFGSAQYAKVGQAFTKNLTAIQEASFSQLVSPDFLNQTIKQAETALADLYTVYNSFGLHPDITLDNIFTRSFFDVIQLYGIYLQALAKHVAQISVSGKIVVSDITNLEQSATLIMTSFDALKGLYFPNQQQLVKDSGSQTVAAETIFAERILLVAAISAKHLIADSSLNYYANCSLALAWSQFIALFTNLPNATYPHTASMNLYVAGYATFDDYVQEVCGSLAKILDGGVRAGSRQMTGSADNNKNVLNTLRNCFGAAVKMYALQDTDVANASSISLQNFFTGVDKVYSDAFAIQTSVTASVNAARQILQTPNQTIDQIKLAVKEFSSAQVSYQKLISTFNSIGDATDAAYCNQILRQLLGDNYIGLACVYWQSFLQDSNVGGDLVATPIEVTNSNVASIIASLNSMCSNAVNVLGGNQNPYAFSENDKTFSIAQMYTNAANAYNNSSTAVSTAGTTSASAAGPVDSIMNLALINVLINTQPNALQTMQLYFQNFGQALQALQTVSSESISVFQNSMQKALTAAETLQSIAQQYPQLSLFLAPIGGDWNKALISTLVEVFQAQSFDTQPFLQYLYGSVLQSSTQYMSSDQKSAFTALLTKLGNQIDILNQAQQSFQVAQAATDITTAIPLWNTALNLAQTYYTLGKYQVSLQDSATRLENYITTAQAYIHFALLKPSDFTTALTIYRVAAQAYCATQSCIKANVALPATITAAALGQLVIQAAHNATNTGVLDFLIQDVQNFTTQTDPVKQLQAQAQLQNDMQQLNIYIKNQQNDWAPFSLQPDIKFAALMSGAAGDKDSYMYTVTTAEGATTNYVISNYNTVVQPATLVQAKTAFQAGQAATLLGDFAAGTKNYSQAAQLFYNASSSMTDPVAITNAQNQYYLSQTRMQASGVARLIQPCFQQTIGDFKNLPTAYMVLSAQIILDPFIVGSLPASLTKSQTTPLSAQQITDFLNVLQIYIVYSALQAKGYNPSTYYKAASLQKVAGLSDTQLAVVSQYEQNAQNYIAQLQTAFTTGFQSGSQTLKLTATLQAQSTGGVAVSCSNLPIPLLIPVTPQGYTAGAYYIGAYQLFQPGTALLNFGSQIYVPGQDVATAGILLQNILQLYVGCAYNYGQIATNLYNQFSSQLSSIENVTALKDKINAMNIAYQNGIAYIQSNSKSQNTAYGYALSLAALNASYSSLPTNVNQYVVDLYSQWATQLKSCLVGDPTSSGYQSVLATLNAIYMQQGNVMPSMATQSHQNIADAFKKAGDACMIFTMQEPINGRVALYPYDIASGYYSAALREYVTLQDATNQNAMNQQLSLVSFSQIEQYAKLYYDVKKNGTTYLNVSGRPQTITLSKLALDYLTYASAGTKLGSSQVIDAGELAEYNRVKDLLLNAAINCCYVQNALVSLKSSNPASSTVQSTVQSTATAQIIAALITFHGDFANLGTTGIDLSSETIRTSLLQYAVGSYKLFLPTPNLLSAYISQISSTISYQYIYDYLGGLPASTASNFATELQTKWTQFFTALQNEAQSLQNPSSSYLG